MREDIRRQRLPQQRPARPSTPAGSGDHRRRTAAAHQRSLGGLDGRARAGNAGRGQSGRLHSGAVQGARAQAGQSRRHVSAERRPDWLQGASDGVAVGAREDRRAQVSRRLHRQLAARPRPRRRSTTPTSSSSATASSRRNTGGMTTKAWTSPVRRSSCWSTIRRSALAGDTTLDSTMFKGRAMTYYGRWTYKYEIASLKGAAAAIIIHETGPAGYPYGVVRGSNSQEQFDVICLTPTSASTSRAGSRLEKAKELLSARGPELRFAQGGRGAQGLQARRASGQGDVRRQDRRAEDPVAQRRRQDRRQPTRRTNTSSTRRTGTTSARTRRSKATRSTTARWTTRAERRRC